MVLPANSELVLEAWLATVPGLIAGQIGTTLPGTAAWAANGFVLISGVVGGSPALSGGIRQPVSQLDGYAVPPTATDATTTGKPPWGKAARLLELVVSACFDETNGARADLALKTGYRHVRVLDVWPSTEPMRMRGEPEPTARYTLDLSMMWAELPE